MSKDLEHYNNVYSNSLEYSKRPKDSIYFPIWSTILSLTNSDEHLIEIGCGPGQLANLLLNNGRMYCFGFDYSEVAIGMAQRLNPDFKDLFRVMDIYQEKELPDGLTVICTEVLEHLDDDLYVINLLKPGTRFIFSVPNFQSKTHKRTFKGISDICYRYKTLRFCRTFTFDVGGSSKIFLIDSVKI